MSIVRAKKGLGQHFLKNKDIAYKIAELIQPGDCDKLIEVGPGMGMLTTTLFKNWKDKLQCFELDIESVSYLQTQAWAKDLNVVKGDFLRENLHASNQILGIIGNYPYNISTEIAFRAIECEKVVVFAGMFQKEVAERFCAKHGTKTYGVTSVLLQAIFDCEYKFTVDRMEFNPPPKVQSGVMLCKRKTTALACEYKTLKTVVKTAFGMRRKTLSNSLKSLQETGFILPEEWKSLRAEQLSVTDFISLAQNWDKNRK